MTGVASCWDDRSGPQAAIHGCVLSVVLAMFRLSRPPSPIFMRVRRPRIPLPPAGHEGTVFALFGGRPVSMPVAAPHHPASSRNAPIRICPKRAIAADPTARRWSAPSAPLSAPPDRRWGICPERAAAVHTAPRPSTPFRAPPGRSQGICPKRHPVHRHRAAAQRSLSATPAP